MEQESCTVTAANGTIRRKCNLQRTDAEEQADRAATEIVDLVEQDAQHSERSLTGSSTPLDMHTLSTSTNTSAMLRSAGTEQEEEVAIPEWVITESREMNRFFLKNLKLIKNNDNALPKTKPLYSHIKLENYVTPPAQLFF